MKKRNHLFFFWLGFTFLLSLLAFSYLYQTEQYRMILESNYLRSPNFVSFSPEQNPDWKDHLKQETRTYWILGRLEESSAVVFGIASNRFSDLILPLKSGTGFSDEGAPFAIVGENVPTMIKGKTKLFVLREKQYPVIGELGLASHSALSTVALINDPDLLAHASLLTFNAYQLPTKKLALNDSRLGDSKGLIRLFNLNRYQKMFTLVSSTIFFLSATLWAILFYHARKDHYFIYDLIGLKQQQILKKELLLLGRLMLTFLGVLVPFLFVLPAHFSRLLLQQALFLLSYTFLFFDWLLFLS